MRRTIVSFLLIVFLLTFGNRPATAQTNEFSYQGRLVESGNPVTGARFFRFTLFDENGNAIPGASVEQTLLVAGGIFSATLDFGPSVFSGGANRSLQIEIKINSGDVYTVLNPRQPILSSPFSIASKSADNAAKLGGVPANQYVLTNDLRLFDARTPTAGSGNYIQNTTSQQPANFNISGNGFVGGNFGIGTLNPLSKLTLQTFTSNYGFLQTDGNIVFGTYLGGNAGGGWFGTVSNHPLHFYTNNSLPRMTITQDGLVGIGTSQPTYLLDVTHDNSPIRGIATGAAGAGIFGQGFAGVSALSNFGVPNTVALYADNNGSNTVGYAGFFQGRVQVNGTLSKLGGSFKIDHPLDPANKYLSHSFVESPDMMNIYNGNVVTDAQGEAKIVLPDYFTALNRDFRYQLTVIGIFAQAIVAQEIKKNSFTIRTDKPNVKVSWQVTGIRQDAYANENRIQVEEDKSPTDRGLYLYPRGFNQPDEKRIAGSHGLRR